MIFQVNTSCLGFYAISVSSPPNSNRGIFSGESYLVDSVKDERQGHRDASLWDIIHFHGADVPFFSGKGLPEALHGCRVVDKMSLGVFQSCSENLDIRMNKTEYDRRKRRQK